MSALRSVRRPRYVFLRVFRGESDAAQIYVATADRVSCLGISANIWTRKDLLSADYSKCIEQSGGTDAGMLDCMGAEAERQDKKLNDVYKKLMNQLTPARKKQLQETQRIWIKSY